MPLILTCKKSWYFYFGNKNADFVYKDNKCEIAINTEFSFPNKKLLFCSLILPIEIELERWTMFTTNKNMCFNDFKIENYSKTIKNTKCKLK